MMKRKTCVFPTLICEYAICYKDSRHTRNQLRNNRLSCFRIVTCDRWVNGQTDMAKLKGAGLQLLVVNAPEECFLSLALRE